jgi:DNA-binding MarR family transcriptional regulator
MNDFQFSTGAEAEKIPGYLLWQVSKLWQRHLNEALKGLGLSSTQAIILINVPRLNQEKRTVTQMLLAEVTKIDRVTLSQSIRTLERNGLIQRITASSNKRAYHVTLTPTGSKVAMQAMQHIISAHQTFFSPLAEQTDKYVTLTQTLIQANNKMEETNESVR